MAAALGVACALVLGGCDAGDEAGDGGANYAYGPDEGGVAFENTGEAGEPRAIVDEGDEGAARDPADDVVRDRPRDRRRDARDARGEPDEPDEPDEAPGDPRDVEPDPRDRGDAPANLNAGWIGGACGSDAECGLIEGGYCLLEPGAPYPGGHCTQGCDLYCPDQEGAVTTFCVDASDVGVEAAGGLCHMRCDFGLSPTGCRAGYQCAPMARHGQPDKVVFTCVPGEAQAVELTPCQQALVDRGVPWSPAVNPKASPDGHPSLVCDIQDPVYVGGSLRGVDFRYASSSGAVKDLFASCELALALDESAELLAAQGVSDVIHLGIYNCRIIGGSDPPKLSQHGLANAIDIRGVRMADGSEYEILGDWEKGVALPVTDAGSFLRWMADALFEWVFNIVLTPEYNAAHADHLHCDLTAGASFLK